MVKVEVVPTSELGDRSYVAHDGRFAIVIDPQRDVERITDVLARHALQCVLVVETHIHNDYVTGGCTLARQTGAEYVVAASDDVAFERHAVRDGDELYAGTMRMQVVATPGHTEGHLAFIVSVADQTPVVFTGGSLLFGSVGRTDLVDQARVDELSRSQYHSVRHLAALLPDASPVYPTHGFGSFCSSGAATGGDDSTVGVERSRNDALVIDNEDEFVRRLVAGLTAYPSYYVHMTARNLAGPGPVDASQAKLLDPSELARRVAAGEWVVDLRQRTAFAGHHLEGTISIELGESFSTYLGWLFPWGTPLTLIGETSAQVDEARRQLTRIGIDELAGMAVGPTRALAPALALHHYPRATFADLARESEPTVLDVRRPDETAAGSIAGSFPFPLHSLLGRLEELPPGQLWVHCASGFRASIAASMLDRAGRDVVLIDDDFENARGVVRRPETRALEFAAPRPVGEIEAR